MFKLLQAYTTLSLHFGLAGLAVAAALAFAWFSPVFKKTALWVALSIVIVIVSYGIGVKNTNDLWNAKEAHTAEVLAADRAAAEKSIAADGPVDRKHLTGRVRNDPFNRDSK